MIYCCTGCRYVFEKDVRTAFCPDCGKERVRYAARQEIEEYFRLQREFYPEKGRRRIIAEAG